MRTVETPIRVRYGETDAQGFVFNAHYLLYADVAMTEFFRALGWGYPALLELGYDPSLVASELQFCRPAHLDDELTLTTSCQKLGSSSLVLQVIVQRSGEQLAEITNTYVNVDTATETSQPIPPEIREAIELLDTDRTRSAEGAQDA